jgi:hypothetical protein
MKKLILIAFLGIALIGKGQCMGDSIVSVSHDSLYVGDTLSLTAWYDVSGASNNDSAFLNLQNINTYYINVSQNIADSLHPKQYGNLKTIIIIPANSSFDTAYTKVYVYISQSLGCGSLNTIRNYIYVRTHKPTGIQTISGNNYKPIKEVRYYTITGQIYGTFSQKQNNLPEIPLIEEVIYNDNSINTRELIHL